MVIIRTTDNNNGKTLRDLIVKDASSDISKNPDSTVRDLKKIANLSLGELCDKNKSLLVFPKVLGGNSDEIDLLPIFTMCGSEENVGDAKISTGNLMGFVGVNETQVEITSRFTPDGQDYFLYYMLQKVFSLNLFELKHLSGKGPFNFLIFLFQHFLIQALSQGMLKMYRTFSRNDANMKGTLDVSRHIKQNVPFAGEIAYNSRERSCDNDLTQLVRHTIEEIKKDQIGRAILSRNEDIHRVVDQIVLATPSYKMQDRSRIIAKNAKPLNHPYFYKWTSLQRLCLAILRHRKLSYGESRNQIHGILFDGAWLWEEYLATILKSAGFKHPKNKERSGGLRMFDNTSVEEAFDKKHCRIYPDFYKEGQSVLDAKYKHLTDRVDREDLYQVVTYMHTMKLQNGGFLYPETKTEVTPQKYKLAGYGGCVHVIGVIIPSKADGYETFVKGMRGSEQALEGVVREFCCERE